jgi:hypothetical protein
MDSYQGHILVKVLFLTAITSKTVKLTLTGKTQSFLQFLKTQSSGETDTMEPSWNVLVLSYSKILSVSKTGLLAWNFL